MKLYHGTPTSNVPSIMRDGLRAYTNLEPVHLTNQVEHAEGVSACVHDADDVTLLEVDVDGLVLGPGGDGEGTWTHEGDIAPSRLRVMTWDERQAVWLTTRSS